MAGGAPADVWRVCCTVAAFTECEQSRGGLAAQQPQQLCRPSAEASAKAAKAALAQPALADNHYFNCLAPCGAKIRKLELPEAEGQPQCCAPLCAACHKLVYTEGWPANLLQRPAYEAPRWSRF